MKILFIGPRFNNYQKTINSTIHKSGLYSKVDYISDCPLGDIGLFAIITNICPSLKSLLIKRYNNLIKNKIHYNKYNVIFIIRGEFVNPNVLKLTHEEIPDMKIIVYQWDSIKNNKNAKNLFQIADETYTFDYKDSEDYELKYVPLFYSWKESGVKEIERNNQTIDIMSIGTYRKNRVPYINVMKNICERQNLKYKFHNFMRLGAFIKNRQKLGIKFADVNFNRISYRKYYSILQESKAVLDIQSPTQSGLTIRTMETLSLGKKLITTNSNIKKEPFYNSNNVFIINTPDDLYTQRFNDFLIADFLPTSGLLTLTEWLKRINVL